MLTYGVVSGLVADPADVTIVQIDAHADLADELGDRRWSHGTVMRRLWERGLPPRADRRPQSFPGRV